MSKSPIAITGIGLLIAIAINVYFYYSGTDLTDVVSRTLFADMLILLTLVPVTEAVRIKNSSTPPSDTPQRIKTSMQTVALYIIGIAAITVLLFNLYGEPLVAAKLNDMADQADQFIAKGEITHEQATEYLTSIEKFYRIGVYLPVLVLTNLLVGFVSSIPAALLIKK